MQHQELPRRYAGTPHRHLLVEGTPLWRIHGRKTNAVDFTKYNPQRTVRTGRFDGSHHDQYDTINVGLDSTPVVVETLLRGIPSSSTGFRTLRRVAVAGQRVSVITTATELSLVSLLDGPALAAAAQTAWLIHSEDCLDPELRKRASWLREHAPWAQGFVWPLRQDNRYRLVVLFGDRCGPEVFEPKPRLQFDLDDEYGARWLNTVLVPYKVTIALPRSS